MQIFNGTVAFDPDQEPRDGGFGPSYNVNIQLDDGQAIPPNTRVNDRRQIRIYRKATDPDSNYILSLTKGTKLQVGWDGKGWTFVQSAGQPAPVSIPATFAPAQGYNSQPTYGNQSQLAVYEQSDTTRLETKLAIAGDLTAEYVAILNLVNEATDNLTLPVETAKDIATTIFIQVQRTYKAGMKVVRNIELDDVDEDLDEAIIGFAKAKGAGSLADKLIDAILVNDPSGHYKHKNHVIEALKSLGLGSAYLDPSDTSTWTKMAHVAWDYAKLRAWDVPQEEAAKQVIERHDLASVIPW